MLNRRCDVNTNNLQQQQQFNSHTYGNLQEEKRS